MHEKQRLSQRLPMGWAGRDWWVEQTSTNGSGRSGRQIQPDWAESLADGAGSASIAARVGVDRRPSRKVALFWRVN